MEKQGGTSMECINVVQSAEQDQTFVIIISKS
jgi:hypothetical protein